MTEPEKEREENGLRPEELFDKTKFITFIVKPGEFKAASQEHTDLVESILDPGLQRVELEELYKLLQKEKLGQQLIETSLKEEEPTRKSKLLAACWEIGFDATSYLLQLTGLVFHKDFQVALEALTIIETIESVPPSSNSREALNWAESQEAPHPDLAKLALLHLKKLV